MPSPAMYVTVGSIESAIQVLQKLIEIMEEAPKVEGTLSILLHLPDALSQPRVYWIACLAVVGGWVYAIPYYVSIDKDSQSVIVSIRGTLSLEDVLTDLVVERAPVCFGGVEGYVHTGMYQSAKYIRNKLIADATLDIAFHRAKGYRLHKVIAGESRWRRLFGTFKPSDPEANHLQNTELGSWFDELIHQEEVERDRISSVYTPLLPPGQILHVLEKYDPNRRWNASPDYYAEWTNCDTFGEIILSRRMIAHHFPDTLLEALRQLAKHLDLESKKDS
ncbi:DGLB-like protein [Mya arenaria]|uniref:DGLB-like protein n=1 Tax=Mya arenaria TaxID=6604 RepID=A0ABY7DMP5_MYAAR|nr:DGLB-like protein [Mya arenaria]